MPTLSVSFRAELRLFAFFLFNGTLNQDVLRGDAYLSAIKNEFLASDWEQLFAVWSNNVELDEAGAVLNNSKAQQRAAQSIRGRLDPNFTVDPPFEDWELELH